MINLLIGITAGYLVAIFLFSRFFIPHLGFRKDKLPENIPADLNKKISEIAKKSKSSYEFLQQTYDFLGTKYHAERFNTFLRFYGLFESLDEVWKKSGFLHCTQMNYLMRIFLVQGGFFKDKDIKVKHTFANFCIHQYLKVHVDGKWVAVDAGEKIRGMDIGKHLWGFG
ncbi:MAG: hypothetical protein V1770_03595 [bacterium]